MDDLLAEVRSICAGAMEMTEGGTKFVYLPSLKVPVGSGFEIRDGLLSLGPHTGYTSRLYVSVPINGRGNNWTTHTVLGRTWHTPSFNQVKPGRPMEMLADHLAVYR